MKPRTSVATILVAMILRKYGTVAIARFLAIEHAEFESTEKLPVTYTYVNSGVSVFYAR